jgi:hypothetical protein
MPHPAVYHLPVKAGFTTQSIPQNTFRGTEAKNAGGVMSGGNWSDPFGAAEYFVDGVAFREVVCPNLLRVAFFAREGNERIIRVKLLVTPDTAMQEQARTCAFLRDSVGMVQ